MYTFSAIMHQKRRRAVDRVREPVQVYLDQRDRELLEQLVEATGLSRAELIRRGLRSLASEKLVERPPGWSMEGLIGAFGDASDAPKDLAEHHDTYLVRSVEHEQDLG